MNILAENLIARLGGTTAVSQMIGVPATTIHAWRRKGIPVWRIPAMKAAASAEGVEVDWVNGHVSPASAEAA